MLYSVKDYFTEVAKNSGVTAFFSIGQSGESGILVGSMVAIKF